MVFLTCYGEKKNIYPTYTTYINRKKISQKKENYFGAFQRNLKNMTQSFWANFPQVLGLKIPIMLVQTTTYSTRDSPETRGVAPGLALRSAFVFASRVTRKTSRLKRAMVSELLQHVVCGVCVYIHMGVS